MAKKLRVGIVVDNELSSDPRVSRQIKILMESGFEVFVLCYGIKGKIYRNIEGITVRRIILPQTIKNIIFLIENSLPLFDWLWKVGIIRFIKKYRVDVIHANDLYMSRPAYRAIKDSNRNIRLILDLHENYPEAIKTYNWTKGIIRGFLSRPWKWEKKEEKYLGYADYIIVLSEWFKATLLDRYRFLKEDNLVVFPNYLDLNEIEGFDRARKQIEFKKEGTVFLYFGVVAERRGIFTVLRTFGKLISEGLNCHLLVIGPVDKVDRLKFNSIVEEDSISGSITHIPWIDISDLPAYMDASDVGLAPFHKNPQHDSGVSNKIFQYMYGELPVIVSDCEAQKEIVERYGCGLVFSTEAELRVAMLKMVTDCESRLIMGRKGKVAVIDELNLERSKAGIQSLYSRLSRAPRSNL